jgi:diaminopimelate decarboxylase
VEHDWQRNVTETANLVGTPCYVFSWPHVLKSLKALNSLESGLLPKHWLSAKTHPLARLFHERRNASHGIEVVSQFEFNAALAAGFSPDDILMALLSTLG